AGAQSIEVDIEAGGVRLTRVRDDRMGIPEAELALALSRHATSKIASMDDLFAIRTLGFRGEALPSIASVSRFEIITKHRSAEHGVRIRVTGGEIETVEDVVSRDGTTVEVADLFYNTPARLKFLKSTPSEV